MPALRRVVPWLLALALITLWLSSLPPVARYATDTRYYHVAAQRVALHQTPYVKAGGYIYPPFLAQALTLLPLEKTAFSSIWNALLALSVLVTIALATRAARLPPLLVAASFALLWTEPVRWGLRLGNASHLVTGILALAAASFWSLPLLAGVLIGIAAAIKIVPGVFLAWCAGAYLRARDRQYLIAGLSGFATLAVTLLHRDTLAFLHAAHGETQLRLVLGTNFSLFSELERATGIAVPGVVGPPLGAAAAFALGLRQRPGRDAALTAFGLVQLLALLSSPVAWSHLFVLAFWPALVASGSILRDPLRLHDPRRWQLQGLTAVMVFCILSRVKLFYLPDHVWGSVVFPLGPLIAVFLIGARLLKCNEPELHPASPDPAHPVYAASSRS
ncbi:MAG TPA: glycosyltransferase family 87 protein [Polyangiales bacterium]|nr:glycosyltransferase family 87 protein [Polyangiales bacterium]